MFTPIHRALGLEPGNISIDLLVKAVERSVEETGDLDWKRVAYDSRRPGWDEEAAKDIAAMANSGGLCSGLKKTATRTPRLGSPQSLGLLPTNRGS